VTAPARYEPLRPTAAVSRAEISQATAVEQSRAVAEVQAAVLVAQQRPRNKSLAVEEMRDATAQTAVAEKAYYRFPRGGENITGVSIHLARELARCWGNIDYGIKELRRDDDKGESEMLAHAWDMQTNARASTTFIVPHVRDTGGAGRKLTATRDIYENNANAGARRLREQILAVLPNWFTEEAKANCDATLKKGNGQPIEERIAAALGRFADIGITVDRLEAKLGRPSAEWDGADVGQLGTIYKSIKRGETTIDAEFGTAPDQGITAEDVAKAGRKRRASATEQGASGPVEKPDISEAPAVPPAVPDQQESEEGPAQQDVPPAEAPRGTPPTDQQVKELQAALRAEGLKTPRAQVAYLNDQFDRHIGAIFDLTGDECAGLTHYLMTAPDEAAAPGAAGTQLPVDGEASAQ